MNRLTAIVLIVIGIALLYWGYEEYNSLTSQMNKLVSGTPTTKTLLIFLAGGISTILGLVQLIRK